MLDRLSDISISIAGQASVTSLCCIRDYDDDDDDDDDAWVRIVCCVVQ